MDNEPFSLLFLTHTERSQFFDLSKLSWASLNLLNLFVLDLLCFKLGTIQWNFNKFQYQNTKLELQQIKAWSDCKDREKLICFGFRMIRLYVFIASSLKTRMHTAMGVVRHFLLPYVRMCIQPYMYVGLPYVGPVIFVYKLEKGSVLYVSG
jgi:hypothetical protein